MRITRRDRASGIERARRPSAFVVIGRGQSEERPGEIVHAGICIQTSPRVCVPINYTVRPMSRYLPTYARVSMGVRVCVCVRSRYSAMRLVPRVLYYYSREHAHIPWVAARTYLIATDTVANECDLSPRCRGSTAADHVLSTTFPFHERAGTCYAPLNIASYVRYGVAFSSPTWVNSSTNLIFLIEKSIECPIIFSCLTWNIHGVNMLMWKFGMCWQYFSVNSKMFVSRKFNQAKFNRLKTKVLRDIGN